MSKNAGNEAEAEAYAEAKNLATRNVAEIALHIAALPKKTDRPRLVVFTQGTLPTIVAYEGKTSSYPIIKVDPSNLVDTNGAGDGFCGGFLSQVWFDHVNCLPLVIVLISSPYQIQFVQGKPIEQCVAGGLYLASIVVQRSGPTYPKEPSTFTF